MEDNEEPRSQADVKHPRKTFWGCHKSGGSPPRIFLNLADDHYPPCPTFFLNIYKKKTIALALLKSV